MWVVLALLTAIFTSMHDALSKKVMLKVDAYVVAWAWLFFSLPPLYICLSLQKTPVLGAPFGMAVAASTVIVTIAAILYFRGIEASDLSITMPMLAFTPFFLLGTSPLMLGEFPRPMGFCGILLIVVGCYILNLKEHAKGYLAPFRALIREKGPRSMLVVALLFSIGANIDKIGVRASSPIMWIAALNTAIAAALFAVMLVKSRDVPAQIKRGGVPLVMIGVLNALALICQMYAIRLTIVPYLISIKRMSVVMTSILGFIFFGEKDVRNRLIGVLMMVAGAVLISIYG